MTVVIAEQCTARDRGRTLRQAEEGLLCHCPSVNPLIDGNRNEKGLGARRGKSENISLFNVSW